MIKVQKRPNTDPQGAPEADDRLSGKLIGFSTISMKIKENHRKSTRIKEYLRKSTSVNEIKRKPTRINEHR